MSLKRCGLYLVIVVAHVAGAGRSKQDEVGRCGLTGVYKMRQSLLQSPLYPENYPHSGCWDYVVRSPYRCPTKFHIQFLEFFLESSSNCTNDYVAVGLERDGEDIDLLCGQIVGIKKYHTPDGDLRLRFHSDDAPWTTEKGFKLLVTRLACEREDFEATNFQEVNDNSDRFYTLPLELQLPNNNYSGPFRNSISHAQYETPVRSDLQNFDVPHSKSPGLRDLNLPVGLISSALPELHHEYFNEQISNKDGSLQQQHLASVRTANREVGGGERYGSRLPTSILEPCCAESFRQKHFYLSSPGFPRTAFTSLLPVSQRDCQFHLEKISPSVCRLRIEFKFFDFGQTSNGNGENQGDLKTTQETTQDVCTEDYLEIDGERFCGCRSGHVFAAVWGLGMKVLRLRMGFSGIASSGFLLDVVQEVCSITQLEHQPGQMVASQPYGLVQFGNQQPPVSHLHETQQNFPFLFPQRPLVYPEQQQQPVWRPEHVPNLPPTQPNYRFPQFGRAKRLSVVNDAQPVPVVKTNTQRNEYYFVDDDAVYTGTTPQETQLQRRRYKKREAGEGVGNTRFYPGIFFREKDRCRFETNEILRLSVDVLWLTKPTCYAAVRSWLGNFFG